jgi:hypothetical protein
LICIIRKKEENGLTLNEIENEFKNIFKIDFDSLKVGPLPTYIALRNKLFSIDNEYKLR